MNNTVAIVGMACRYPDVNSPRQLWENVLAGRQAFRRLPPERIRLDDYFSADRAAGDATYGTTGAVIAGYEFDRARFRVPAESYRAADPSHWLALEVTGEALADAGYPDGRGLAGESTGVLMGNSLTGDVSRANSLRLRWPYVRRVVEEALRAEGLADEWCRAVADRMEARFKAPFPVPDGETLAGGLSNTIAGRICGHFRLHGGGYTIDGACASSLLAVASACTALVSGDLDVAIAGGVDLSLDPFELVGFAKAGALSPGEMRVYDRDSSGFLPGEGCGVLILMRHDDAMAQGKRTHALIRGWGVSSDGGGVTRPEAEGQVLALRRAYWRAGIRPGDVGYFEGHGTGTPIGDATEVEAISRSRAGFGGPAAVIGSVKVNVGHTKAAAGVAGLMKAVCAVQSQVLPPTTGCASPLPALGGAGASLRAGRGECWPADRPLYAGVSAMGFGGVNAHVVIEGTRARRRERLGARTRRLLRSPQDAELVLLGGATVEDLARQAGSFREQAGWLSRAELADLAAYQARRVDGDPVRAALVASSPAELGARLDTLLKSLRAGAGRVIDPDVGIFLSTAPTEARVGFVFPGQASPVRCDGGAWARRFDAVRAFLERLPSHGESCPRSTATGQPTIVAVSLSGAGVLEGLGIRGAVAIGHSLGELSALAWAGVTGPEAMVCLAAERGRLMAAAPAGAMLALAAGPRETAELVAGTPAVVACLNSPRQAIVSGSADVLAAVEGRARARGVRVSPLPVDRAFHSPLMAGAARAFAEHLAGLELGPVSRPVVSTVTGALLPRAVAVRDLLARQFTSPVRFTEAVAAAGHVDLWIEVGPGATLAMPLREATGQPCVSLDAGGPSLRGLLQAAGACFVLDAIERPRALFDDRFTRPIDPASRPRFLANPCEQLPSRAAAPVVSPAARPDPPPASTSELGVMDLLRQILAARLELSPSAINEQDRLLRDLHLNSIAVGQLVAEAAAALDLPPPAAPTAFATATVGETARALYELTRRPGPRLEHDGWRLAGVDAWVRPFAVELIERPLAAAGRPNAPGTWQVGMSPGVTGAEAIRAALCASGRDGVAVVLPPDPDERHVELLLEGARAALRRDGPGCFVLVQHGGWAGAFARSLYAEAPDLTVCVVDLPAGHPLAPTWLGDEVRSAAGYREAHYDNAGRRRVPVLAALPAGVEADDERLGPADVVLVTGGGRGITAECALALARSTGAALAILGRADPDADPVLAANLRRFEDERVRVVYLRADVTDAEAVGRAVRAAGRVLGPITSVIHGAGENTPRALHELDSATVLRTLGPKVGGLRNVLAAVGPLRLLVTFGSVIARTGMPGEADYALANQWQTQVTERYQADHPGCRCLAIEWSVWAGVGMGERLGRLDALVRQGITPITTDRGLEAFSALLARRVPAPAVVVSGRLGDTPTLSPDRPPLPVLRFLETPRVFYPGIELVADAELATETDPYLDDHSLRGERLFPAVLGLEAVAQAARVLLPPETPLALEDVGFDRPILVPVGRTVPVRVAALVRGAGQVDVVLRSDGFHVDNFRAKARAAGGVPAAPGTLPRCDSLPRIALDPHRDLYGGVLFQSGRFRRLLGYRVLRASECLAEVAGDPGAGWFGPFTPGGLLLGDPGVRDAALHAVQGCIPHAVVLPVGIDRFTPGCLVGEGPFLVHAVERSRGLGRFLYDVTIATHEGVVLERIEGLRLQSVADVRPPLGWPSALLGPYVERRVGEMVGGHAPGFAFEFDGTCERRARGERALRRLIGDAPKLAWRPDGMPTCCGDGRSSSISHAGGLSAAVVGAGRVACDLELIADRPRAVWDRLLACGRSRLTGAIQAESGDDPGTAGTRLWVAQECLTKAGLGFETPLVLKGADPDGWVRFGAGPWAVSTLATAVRELGSRVVFGVLSRSKNDNI